MLPQKNLPSDSLSNAPLKKDGPAEHLLAIMRKRDIQDVDKLWMELSEGKDSLSAVLSTPWVDELGADIPDDATETDLYIIIQAARVGHRMVPWVRGDAVVWIRKKYGQINMEEAQKLAELFGCSVKRLLNNASTAAAIPKWVRSADVPMNVYEMLATIEDPEIRIEYAQRAAAERWDIRYAAYKAKEANILGKEGEYDLGRLLEAAEKVNPDGAVNTRVAKRKTLPTYSFAEVRETAAKEIREIYEAAIEGGLSEEKAFKKALYDALEQKIISISPAYSARIRTKGYEG